MSDKRRFPVSGTNATAILAATASSPQTVYDITTGRVFWLRGVAIARDDNGGDLDLRDIAAGTATATAPVVRLPIASATGLTGLRSVTEFSPPGLKFSTNVSAVSSGGASNQSVGAVAVWGYEE